MVPRDARVILPHVGRTPGYKKLVSDLVAVARLPLLSPQAALLKYKEILREAARLLRNRSWAKKRPNKRDGFPIALAVSRAFWRRDKKTAITLAASTEFGKKHISFSRLGVPELADAQAFAEEYAHYFCGCKAHSAHGKGSPAYFVARTSPDRAWPSNSSTRLARPHMRPSSVLDSSFTTS